MEKTASKGEINGKHILISLNSSHEELPEGHILSREEIFRNFDVRIERANNCADKIRGISGILQIEVNQLFLVVACSISQNVEEICNKIRKVLKNKETVTVLM
ncbi:MAG: hypothetical protein KAS32_26510 [Candidatus Peribacteraceae bacterium]|nr:hypothetical protein [Candidatus Peribacteraceae bacterium]